ncbi:MAG TPA: dihydrolipoyl dehydrogenase [Tepidisphaeraceae bacterium]|jgi:dihydrolipoamide dehydrogenase
MSESSYDLIVIGAGPGGYVAAIRGAQLGMKVACVEREFLGGTCLNIGCIPSKALLDSSERYATLKHGLSRHGISTGDVSIDIAKMLARKDDVVKKNTDGVAYLFKKNKIDHLKGHGRIKSANEVEVLATDGTPRTYGARNILVATGSAPIQIPSLPFDKKYILSSTEALAIPQVPKRMIVVGGGYIGVELGSVWSRLGADVLVLEFMDRILPPSDGEMALALQKLLQKQGLKFRFNTVAQSAKVVGDKVQVTWKSGEETGVEEVDKVLVSVGRKPVTDNLGLERLGIALDKKGFITVNERFQTAVESVYAIGDVIGGITLAHKAEEEGVAAVEAMAGHHAHVNYHACPSVVYTHPQLAQVGLREEDAKAKGPIKIGKFPFTANGYARAIDEVDGLVKVISDANTDRVLGIHILGPHAADLIAEATLAVEFASSAEDIGRSFHSHPTLSEALKEAALGVDKQSIHI